MPAQPQKFTRPSANRRPGFELQAWFIVGPTASGKSAVAQFLAERENSAILSADAMLVYRGMDIGTAKPTAAERARVRYYGLDIAGPREQFSAGAYRLAIRQALRDEAAWDRQLIVAGGTGLYVKILTDGLSSRTPAQAAVREEAERRLAQEGVGALQAWLKQIDPQKCALLADPNNPRRLIRALEIALAGTTTPKPASWHPARTSPLIPGLMWSAPQLYDRIQRRVQAMFTGGLLEEVERLLQAGFDEAPTAGQAIGYREAKAYLRAQCTLEEAMAATVVRTRQLAKRQMTWFRHQCNVEWLGVDAGMTTAEIAEAVGRHWRQHGPTPLVGVKEDDG